MQARFDVNWLVGLLVLTILMNNVLLGSSKVYKPLHWSPLNPVFQNPYDENTTVHRINVFMYSKINIICPTPAINPIVVNKPLSKDNMYENIWSVDETSFVNCVVNTTKRKNNLIFKCNHPMKLTFLTLAFLPTTNIKGQPEFEHGKDYYFIATSNGSINSLGNTELGHCKTKNMKFIIHVCSDGNDPLCNTKVHEISGSKPENETTSHPPTSHTPNAFNILSPTSREAAGKRAAGKGPDCFISVKDRTWLIILVGVLGFLFLVSLLCNIYLCYRRKKTTAKLDERTKNLSSLMKRA